MPTTGRRHTRWSTLTIAALAALPVFASVLVAVLVSVLVSVLAHPAGAASPSAPDQPATRFRGLRSGVLRVGSSGDYPPFSKLGAPGKPDAELEAPGSASQWTGLDLAVARAYAADRGLQLEVVQFAWPNLLHDLEADRFDVAMGGITVRPERSVAGRFTVPVATTRAVALLQPGCKASTLEDLDHRAHTIAVNAGGHLERVTRARFTSARIMALPDNQAVFMALLDRSADVIITDNVEARLWEQGRDLRRMGPLTQDRKAYLVRRDNSDLARDLDQWLLQRERDGTLLQFRLQWLGFDHARAWALPFPATVAAIQERLALMPMVARAKRREGVALSVPEREGVVIEAAIEATRVAAERLGRPAPTPKAVRQLFQALIGAAKALQQHEAALARDQADDQGPTLDGQLRPALLRIGERLATLLVMIDEVPKQEALRQSMAAALQAYGPAVAHSEAIADALGQIPGGP